MKVIEQYDGCEVSSIGIPIIDLNGLKHINDSFCSLSLYPHQLALSAADSAWVRHALCSSIASRRAAVSALCGWLRSILYMTNRQLYIFASMKVFATPSEPASSAAKSICDSRSGTLLNVLPISKYRTRGQSPLKSWNGQAEKGLTLQSIWESTRIYLSGRYSEWQRPWQAMSSTCSAQRQKESPESLRNSRLSRHWQGHKDSVFIVKKYSGVYGLHRRIAVRQVRKWLKYAIFHGGFERLTESLE